VGNELRRTGPPAAPKQATGAASRLKRELMADDATLPSGFPDGLDDTSDLRLPILVSILGSVWYRPGARSCSITSARS
jgi:hypothetical protein